MLLDFDAKKGEAAAAELGDNAAFYKVDVSGKCYSVHSDIHSDRPPLKAHLRSSFAFIGL